VPQAAITQEMLYDELALKCGLDRLAFRRRNVLRDGDKTPSGQVLQAVGMADCLDALAPHWEKAKAAVAAFNATATTHKRGIGIASCWYGCGNTALPNPSTVRFGLTPDGVLRLHQGATDVGQGANTVITQIAADALGIDIAAITLVGPDTALTPDCGKTSASRQTFITGRAAQAAGQALRAAILRLTNLSEATALTLEGGTLTAHNGDTQRRITLAELPQDAHGYVLSAEETYDPPTTTLDENGQGTPYAVYGYGAQIAEVEVDLTLGTTKVLHMTAAHDVGRVINPLLAEGDMPPVTSILIEKPDPEGPMGAKGYVYKRQANADGQIIRCDPLTILDRRIAKGDEVKPFLAADWDGRTAAGDDVLVSAIGAGTTYPDYKPAPFIVSRDIAGVDCVTVVTEAIFSYCGVKVKIDTDRHLGAEAAVVRADGEAIGHVMTAEYGSQMLSLGGVDHLTGASKAEGRVTSPLNARALFPGCGTGARLGWHRYRRSVDHSGRLARGQRGETGSEPVDGFNHRRSRGVLCAQRRARAGSAAHARYLAAFRRSDCAKLRHTTAIRDLSDVLENGGDYGADARVVGSDAQ